jgi:hypothetical protein
MMRRVSTLLAGFLLVSALTLSAQAFTAEQEVSLGSPTQEVGWCWVYIMGRWWELPC